MVTQLPNTWLAFHGIVPWPWFVESTFFAWQRQVEGGWGKALGELITDLWLPVDCWFSPVHIPDKKIEYKNLVWLVLGMIIFRKSSNSSYKLGLIRNGKSYLKGIVRRLIPWQLQYRPTGVLLRICSFCSVATWWQISAMVEVWTPRRSRWLSMLCIFSTSIDERALAANPEEVINGYNWNNTVDYRSVLNPRYEKIRKVKTAATRPNQVSSIKKHHGNYHDVS